MKYVCLEGIKYGNRFFTSYDGNNDPAKLKDGTVAYTVLGFADTDIDARKILYGPACDEPFNVAVRLAQYMLTMPYEKMGIDEDSIINMACLIALQKDENNINS